MLKNLDKNTMLLINNYYARKINNGKLDEEDVEIEPAMFLESFSEIKEIEELRDFLLQKFSENEIKKCLNAVKQKKIQKSRDKKVRR